MKNKILASIIPVLLIATSALAESESKKEIIIRRQVEGGGPHFNIKIDDDRAPLEMEKVAYLGVETMPVDPTVASQLSLPRDTGLVIRRVAEGSPAASLLQKHDILTKLDDQILIDMRQLSVLVRNHKAGDEVKLTLVRGGKETTVKAKLGEREVPKLAMGEGQSFMRSFGESGPGGGGMMFQYGMPGHPGMEGREAGDMMRRIGGDRMNWFAKPRVHVIKRHGGKGSTILDLPAGNFVFSDDKGSVELNANEGKRELTVKNKEGKVTFQGPVNTPEDHKKLPADVLARLESVGGSDFGDDDNEIEVETKIMEPATKTRQALPPPREQGNRSL